MKTVEQLFEDIRQTVLTEAIRYADFPKAAKLIAKYVKKRLGYKVFFYPTPESFTSAGKTRVGIRFFVKPNRSFRINWERGKLNKSLGVVSMDYWDGSKQPQPIPTSHVEFQTNQSLATVLPFVCDFIAGDIRQRSGIYTDETNMSLRAVNEELLAEGKSYSEADLAKTVKNMMHAFGQGIQIRQQQLAGGNNKYGPLWHVAQAKVRELYPTLFKKRPGTGKQLTILASDVKKLDPSKIVAAMLQGRDVTSFAVTSGVRETIDVPGSSSEDIDRLTYEEQLDALKTGMKLMMSNATNAMFVGGRGGTGKTQTIENMLHGRGLTDGEGYYKITGSATPVGVYRTLHQYRNEILLFDDSDHALADQEGRNLFKAAADTKKVRKLSWLKGGKNFVDPDLYDEDEDDDKLPRTFEFTGKIIFISNLPLHKLDPDGALQTRGYVMTVDPTNEEIYEFMYKIMSKIELDVDFQLSESKRREVVDVLQARKIADKTANLRSLVRGLNTRAGVEQQGGTSDEWITFVKRFA